MTIDDLLAAMASTRNHTRPVELRKDSRMLLVWCCLRTDPVFAEDMLRHNLDAATTIDDLSEHAVGNAWDMAVTAWLFSRHLSQNLSISSLPPLRTAFRENTER